VKTAPAPKVLEIPSIMRMQKVIVSHLITCIKRQYNHCKKSIGLYYQSLKFSLFRVNQIVIHDEHSYIRMTAIEIQP
jgi:hypothetical protein